MFALTVANLKMMARNRHSTFWALFFPLMLVVVFGLFDIDRPSSATLAIIDQASTPTSQLLVEKLADTEFLRLDENPENPAQARQMLANGDLDYILIIPEGFGENPLTPVNLIYDSSDQNRNQLVEEAINSLTLEAKISASQVQELTTVVTEEVAVAQVSYFDVVLLGLVGLGIMSNSVISVAVKISNYRNQYILKRMLVTPLAIWKYFAAEITAHLILALIQAAIILAVGVFVFGASIPGNVAGVFVIVLLGSLVFLNIGFILSAWANTPSAASGMGNAVTLPMIFFAGTFFSTTSLPWLLPEAAQVLPLTPMLTAMRQVAIDSVPLWEVWPQLAALAGWVVVTGIAAVKVFRFS